MCLGANANRVQGFKNKLFKKYKRKISFCLNTYFFIVEFKKKVTLYLTIRKVDSLTETFSY